ATRRLPPSMNSLPDDCTCIAARCSARQNAAVCCGSRSTPSGNSGMFSAKKVSSSFCSFFRSAPDAFKIFTATGSLVSANKTCSSVTNSWRRLRASSNANWIVDSYSLLMVMVFLAAFVVVCRFQRALQRELRLFRELHHHRDLRLGDLVGVNTGDAHSVLMDVEHDRLRRRLVVMEDVNEQRHHELHRRVVVVEQQHLEQLGPL